MNASAFRKFGFGLLGMLALSAYGLANADPIPVPSLDVKTYPGTGCQQVNTGVENFAHFTPSIYSTGLIHQTTDVACPIVRDNAGNTNGLFGVTVVVVAWDNSSTFTCTVFSSNSNGTLITKKTGQITGNGQQTPQTLNLGGIASSGVNGFYTLQCSVPGASQLVGYTVSEYNPTE